MNKQEIEKALSWVKEVINHQVFERATYEDTYGTGDLSEEERKEVYEEMDNNINLFKTIQCALTQQLNNGWIPISERLPEEKISPVTNDYYEYECTFSTDTVKEVRFYKFGEGHWWHGGGCVDEYVTAWRERPEPWKGDNR